MDVEVLVTIRFVAVVEPSIALTKGAQNAPPVRVIPFEELSPTVSNILMVELAVVLVALKVGKEIAEYKVEVPTLKFPTPWIERSEPGVEVPMPTKPLDPTTKLADG